MLRLNLPRLLFLVAFSVLLIVVANFVQFLTVLRHFDHQRHDTEEFFKNDVNNNNDDDVYKDTIKRYDQEEKAFIQFQLDRRQRNVKNKQSEIQNIGVLPKWDMDEKSKIVDLLAKTEDGFIAGVNIVNHKLFPRSKDTRDIMEIETTERLTTLASTTANTKASTTTTKAPTTTTTTKTTTKKTTSKPTTITTTTTTKPPATTTTTKTTKPAATTTTITTTTTTKPPATTTTTTTTKTTKPAATTTTTTTTKPPATTTTTTTTKITKPPATTTTTTTTTATTKTQTAEEEKPSKGREKIGENQKCVIPNLDPFHPNIRPYISYEFQDRCAIKQYGHVTGGKLLLELNNVQRAGFYYIQRDGDFAIKLSKWHPLKDDSNTILKADRSGCLKLCENNFMITIVGPDDRHEHNNMSLISTSNDRHLKCEDFLITKDERITHVASGSCLTVIEQKIFFSKDICNSVDAIFKIVDGSIIHHQATGKCLKYKQQSFILADCNHESAKFYFQADENQYSYVNTSVFLEEDFVRLDIIVGEKPLTEYHMYPVRKSTEIKDPIGTQQRNNEPIKKTQQDNDKLNIVMLMVDSLSRASAERYMNKTYKMLESDPHSIILKGHTIVGDGTTPQLCAMLVGKQEHELPESRRGFKDSQPVDRWNFIFNDFKKAGYTTLYSEDEPMFNTFHYRLWGFREPPTTKYLRPWWMAAEHMIGEGNRHSRACSHQFSYPYMKEFLKIYQNEPTFSLLVSSALTHQDSKRATLIDQDILDFYKYISNTGYSNNTIVIFFGDHGNRASEFRSSIQGKLEERLPMVSITLPPWFRKVYPTSFQNLKNNSKVMTSHYDIHMTLKHLLDFPGNLNLTTTKTTRQQQDRYGRSLFSDITKLNRTCTDAGIDGHWCPCLTYTNIEANDSLVHQISSEMVLTINKKIEQYTESHSKCALLRLGRIIRASKKVPNYKVQQYEGTFRDQVCDACGVKLNKDAKLNLVGYEIVFTVLPSNGQFEASADFDVVTKTITVNKQISRINLYGNQPQCIAQKYPYLRSYCYCKTFI